ncbi:MAG TPA: CHAT domain-containing protein [Acidobacteriaceae bacterium]|jgi:CHAT domain-containing protein/tetratricopeptide (TPR) repeat protein
MNARRISMLVGLIGFGLITSGSSWGQGGAQTGCGLDARNRRNVTLPVPGNEAVTPAMAAEIQHAFDLLAMQNRGAEAKPLLEKIRVSAQAAHNACGEALAEFGIGEIQIAVNLADALPHLMHAEELLHEGGTPLALAIVHERILVTRHLVGDNAAFLQGAPAVAAELKDAGDTASSIKLRSLMLQYEENGQKPEEQAALAHELESVQTENVPAVRGFLQWEWGSALRRTGRFAEIAAHFQAALTDLAACGCEPQTRAAVLLNMAAAADATGDGATVLRYAQEADAIYVQAGLKALRVQSMRLMAAAYARQREWTKALAEYNDALRLAREQHLVVAIPNLEMEMAATYGDAGQAAAGLHALEDLSQAKLTPTEKCTLASQRTILQVQANALPEALTNGKDALACKDLLQPSSYAALNMSYADALLRTGHPEEGLRSAQTAVAIIDTQRPRVRTTDSALIQFNEHQKSAYTVLIRAFLQSGKPEDALLASEQDRARAFVDLASTDRAPGAAFATPSSPGGAGGSGTGGRRAGGGASGPAGSADLRSEAHPFSMTIADMRKAVEGQHSTLISYWVGDDRLYTWVMAPGKPVIEKDQAMTPVQLAMLVRATLPGTAAGVARGARVMTRGGDDQGVVRRSRKPWSDLYNVLIAPVAAELPVEEGSLLTIIPQGPLFQLSFSALMDKNGKYLVEQHAIHEAPSVGVLQIAEKNGAANVSAAAHYVVLANPEKLPSVNGVPLPALPGTREEARGIEQHLGSRMTLLEGKEAGIDSLKTALPEATVLHFATHSIVDDSAPSSSFLALDTRQEGGKLTTTSVYGLHLHTSLVVLSACRTGRGQITGDGVLGLSRAFFYAGTASLVTTLWDVVDAPTAKMMPDFYAALNRGASNSAALREAQLSLIHDLRTHRVRVPTLSGSTVSLPEDPAYWAAFSLSGQP